MFTYENGVLLAFLLFLYGTLNVLIKINSTMEKNLNKVGMRISWLTLNPKDMTSATDNPSFLYKFLKFVGISLFGLALVLLSWIQVFGFIGLYLYRLNQDYGAPTYIKNYRWNLRNIDMSFDMVAKEMFVVAEKQGAFLYTSEVEKDNLFLEFKKSIVNQMISRGLLVQLMKIKPEISEFTSHV